MRLSTTIASALLATMINAAPSLAATIAVTISNYTFIPATISVHPGDTVIWTNQDSIPHTATSIDGKTFDSGAIDPGDSWKFEFSKTGKFDYRCSIHPDMHGTINVQ